MRRFLVSKKFWLIALVLIVLVWWLSRGSSSGLPASVETGVVERDDVVEVVSETGFVAPVQAVDVTFERSGRVLEVLVESGDVVAAGAPLVRLDDASARAELVAAEARVTAERARLQALLVGADEASVAVTLAGVTAAETAVVNAERNLAHVISQQDQLLDNAETILRTSALQAYLVSGEREDSTRSFLAPIISGTYTNSEQGTYTIELYNSAADSGASFRVSGLETAVGSVSTVNPVPLGTRGLYIQFPTEFAKGTTWEVPVPNDRAGSYSGGATGVAAAEAGRAAAIAAAESAVAAAEATLLQSQKQLAQLSGPARSETVLAQQALITQMLAGLIQAQIQVDNTVVTAPFAGVVAKRQVDVGQVATMGTSALSLLSTEAFELTVAISEVDIAELTVGDEAMVQLDAYPDDYFSATVVRIAPNAELTAGVRVFETTLQFENTSEKIKAGLSADIDIMTAERTEVLAVPTRAIYEDADGRFVRVINSDDSLTKMPVTTGLRGSNGMTEIVAGLQGGETIITFASQADLQLLE